MSNLFDGITDKTILEELRRLLFEIEKIAITMDEIADKLPDNNAINITVKSYTNGLRKISDLTSIPINTELLAHSVKERKEAGQ